MNLSPPKQFNDDGFSSDEEVHHEQILPQHSTIEEVKQQIRQQVKFKLPPPEEIRSKPYSLNPDMATGWAPKNDLPIPIPLVFNHKKSDCMIRRILEKKKSDLQLIYLGPRYESSYYAWLQKPFQFPYSHIKTPIKKVNNHLFCGQNPSFSDRVVFDSFFEGGNLDCVVQVGKQEYDLYIRVDSNTRGHLQWYNFKMRQLEKNKVYKINICNFQKQKSLYSRGMKPYTFSIKRYQKQKIQWQQRGQNITYQKKIPKSFKVFNIDNCSNYQLSFQYSTEYDDDEIQMAYCVPYTYTDLLNFVNSLQSKISNKNIFCKTKLCTSLGGLQVPLLIVQQSKNNEISVDPKIQKKCVIISGRAHPGESNGSHMMQGFLEYLCGDLSSAKKLRENFIFKIVPMLNPDGVALGNYRTGISGKDFNREYINPQKCIFPEVYAFKKLVSQNKAIYGDNLIMFLDFHGHSTKKNVFMYGPEFPIIQKHYYECRVFPKMLSNITNMFRYYSCAFRVSEFKQTTARAVLLRKLMIPFSYTIQASNGSFYDQQSLKDVDFTKKHWQQMGFKIGQCLSSYGNMIVSAQKNRIERRRERFMKKQVRKISKGRSLLNKSTKTNSENTFPLKVIISDDERTKAIFEEIKKAENEKQLMKNEDDAISEGGSDGEDEQDDLPQLKLNFLFSAIKNRKAHELERFHKKIDDRSLVSELQQPQQTESKEFMKKETQISTILQFPKNSQILDTNQILFRPHKTLKFLKNKRTNNAEQKQGSQKVSAKILNCSLFSQKTSSPSPHLNEFDKKSVRKNKSDRGETFSNNRNRKVLDLSKKGFRQTFGTNFINTEKFVIVDPRTTTFYRTSPRKIISRLDQYKYRRLFINQQN